LAGIDDKELVDTREVCINPCKCIVLSWFIYTL
jgi:hypothetical protein